MKKFVIGVFLAMSTFSESQAQDLPLNVEEWRSAIEIIEHARSKIEDHGWYQVEAVAGAECMATALESSWKELGKSLVDWDYARLAVDSVIDAPQMAKLSDATDPLSAPYWGRYYMYWNDAKGRTEEDVVAALSKAVEFAKSQEKNAMETNASGEDVIEFDIRMMDQLGLPMDEKFR